ncbi:Phytanoyl-CoA dioxygenase [Niveomyces insectorum RCEF 264]|uniref:Phytanoyl-CoA dioxygenase n=1 Tax=Niveomyces insectorum RCEF 264 TaxID=1081102 RepID=A0A167MN70_9HYPO|nr:Phytanoyl-CoA dioxygenase [Niveomyces insectorum RCEF 264]
MAPSIVDVPPSGQNGTASKAATPAKKTYCHITPVSAEDRLNGTTSLETVQSAVEAFHRDGFCAISNAIDTAIVDKLNARMLEDTPVYLERPTLHYNQGQKARNISQMPPVTPEYMFREIWANPHAMTILEYLLGPRPECRFVNSNTALPNTDPTARQAVHSDAYHDHPNYPWAVVLNIYLTDVSPANGATEVWPGTHNITSKAFHVSEHSGRIRRPVFLARAQTHPPGQVTIPKGSICFRDLRTWHAGMPNLSTDPRIMLALVYFPRFYRSPMRLRLPASVRSIVTSWPQVDFETGTDWVDVKGDENSDEARNFHLNLLFQANWTQEADFGVFSDGKHGIQNKVSTTIEPEVTRDDYWLPGDS